MAFKVIGLTGKTRYRTNFMGRIILQVEESKQYFDSSRYAIMRNNYALTDGEIIQGFWRDARLEDFEKICKLYENETNGKKD